jgi:hypothetical protein
MKKKIIKWIGNLLVILIITFIVNIILKTKVDFSILLKPRIIICILALACVCAFIVVFDTIAGRCLIKDVLERDISFKSLYKIYSKSNIAKYLPGNVMHYVSRGVYCSEYNIKPSDIFYVSILEVLLKIITAFLVTLFLSYKQLNKVFEIVNLNITMNFGDVVIIGILLLIILFVFIFHKQHDIKKSLVIEAKMIRPMLAYTAIFCVNAIPFIFTIYLLSKERIYDNTIVYVIGVYTMAWLVGYITPGAPGGIGIKETILLVLLSPIYGQNLILLVAVITRIINVLGDIFAYIINITDQKFMKGNGINE